MADNPVAVKEKSSVPRKSKRKQEDDFNRRALMQIVETQNLAPLDDEDVDEMERRFNNYLRYCIDNNLKIGNMNAYRAIGITAEKASYWLSGRGFENKRRTEFIRRVQQICASYREMLMQENKISVPVGIFWQKNYDGLKDVSESIVHHDEGGISNQTAEELEARYADVVDAEIIEVKTEKKAQKKGQGK